MRSMEAYKVRTVLEGLVEAEKPGEALWNLATRADDESATAFERYAGAVLRDAGALDLAQGAQTAIHLQRCADESLVRLFATRGPLAGESRKLQVLEDALNRLLGVGSALEHGVGSQIAASPESPSSRRRQKYAIHGANYPLWSDPARGAHVHLPPLAPHEQPASAYFCEVDWRMLDGVAGIAHLCYQSTILANSNQVVFGVKGPHGSEWDVRTRLASSLHNLWVSLRMTYRFDCDLSRNVATVHFNLPPLDSFPTHVADLTDNTMKPVGNRLGNARTAYALRLASLIASTCFGAGRSVDHAFVVGLDEKGAAAVSCSFTRQQFVHETLPAIDTGRISAPELRFDPEGIVKMLPAGAADFAQAGRSPLPTGNLKNARIAPSEDERILPDDMQRLFHALRVCDIDVARYHGDSADAIDEARKDSKESTMAAVARLENVVDDLEARLAPPDMRPNARPLHCENALQRVAIALLDDELAIGAKAEAFLSFEDDGDARGLPDVYYYRSPSALYHAHIGLADLYRALGDDKGAEAHADRCIALGPTMPAGYALKAGVLSRGGKNAQAANVIMMGLKSMLADADRALLLFELAAVFRRMGRSSESEAMHICSANLKGIYAQRSLEVISSLESGVNAKAFAHANLAKAQEALDEVGIPLVSDRIQKALVARAALGLANAHAPQAAAPYIALLQEHFPTNRAITIACNSIRHGLN